MLRWSNFGNDIGPLHNRAAVAPDAKVDLVTNNKEPVRLPDRLRKDNVIQVDSRTGSNAPSQQLLPRLVALILQPIRAIYSLPSLLLALIANAFSFSLPGLLA